MINVSSSANDNYVDFDIVVYRKPHKNWRARILFAGIVFVGYVGGGLFSIWYAYGVIAGALAEGVGSSAATAIASVSAAMIYSFIIMFAGLTLFWAFGSEGKVARFLRGT